MKRLAPLLIIFLAALSLLNCGGGHKHPSHAARSSCPVGQSFMGCSNVAVQHGPSPAGAGGPARKVFPDVYEGNGSQNWAAAKSHISMAVIKAYEFRTDHLFVQNAHQLAALHIPYAAYDFVRSCNASGFIQALRSVGGPVLVPVLDWETSDVIGCASSLDRQIFAAFHVHPLIYTAPGTWPGGSSAGLKLWIAEYGPNFNLCSRLWTCSPVGWQFSDGRINPTPIPGLSLGDMSIDFGFSSLFAHPVAVDPYAIFVSSKFLSKFGWLNEKLVVEQFDGAVKHLSRYRNYVRNVLQPELRFLAARILFVAVNQRKGWGGVAGHERGPRFQFVIHRAERQI